MPVRTSSIYHGIKRGSVQSYFFIKFLVLLRLYLRTDDSGLEIDKDGPGHVFAGAGLAEERVEAVVATAQNLVGGHLAVGLDAMLQAVQFPAGVTDLNTGLADVH